MTDSKDGEQSLHHTVGALREQITRLERLVQPEVHAVQDVGGLLKPAWLKATEGENRLPVAAAIAAAIALQVVLPAHLVFRPTWLLPALESALLVGLVIANPKRINRSSTFVRAASLSLIAAISLANLWSAGHLIRGLINHTEGSDAGPLLANGASIYITNIVAFGLWYWEFDRGGPVARAQAQRKYPDFLFPQMSTPELSPPDWAPNFIDYLYVSFTNATAFSPTDVMPLSRWAKLLMGVQSAISLATVGLVIARAVNILK
jgi:hypothetical protein